MLLNKPLKCVCGKKPKLSRNNPYYKYSCSCGLQTFFSKTEETARELWNSGVNNYKNLKVKI